MLNTALREKGWGGEKKTVSGFRGRGRGKDTSSEDFGLAIRGREVFSEGKGNVGQR